MLKRDELGLWERVAGSPGLFNEIEAYVEGRLEQAKSEFISVAECAVFDDKHLIKMRVQFGVAKAWATLLDDLSLAKKRVEVKEHK